MQWPPVVGSTFQIQYAGTLDLSVAAQVHDFDVDATPASTVAAIHARPGHPRVLCYIDAGAWESYRGDAARFPTSVLGRAMEGWPDERWLDIRRIDLLAPILRNRIATCRAKGFDGIDPDNLNGYTNDTGFPPTFDDQLRFNRWVASEAHAVGLAVMLKNDGDQATQLVRYFDGAVVEQCVHYAECNLYSPFVAAGKAVFDIEYSVAPAAFCRVASANHLTIVGKHLDLDAYRTTCPG